MVVKGWDPKQKGDKCTIEVEVTWDDPRTDTTCLLAVLLKKSLKETIRSNAKFPTLHLYHALISNKHKNGSSPHHKKLVAKVKGSGWAAFANPLVSNNKKLTQSRAANYLYCTSNTKDADKKVFINAMKLYFKVTEN